MRDTAPIRILIIDDDRKLCRLITDYLAPFGYEVSAAHEGEEGLEKARAFPWHAILLDLMLPGMDGFELLRQLRVGSNVPVLMLTARGDESDRIVGLELGADDYLPKTFSTRELLARLRAVIRRSLTQKEDAAPRDAPISIGLLQINPGAHSVYLEQQLLALTPVEYDLLLCLAQSLGRVKTREQLLEQIRDRNYEVFDRSIDVHISSLRKKLGDDPKSPRFIRTVRSAGYLLINPGTPDG
jgi:DNA-binding response OmpR family regulator